jgi:hypothetical protein
MSRPGGAVCFVGLVEKGSIRLLVQVNVAWHGHERTAGTGEEAMQADLIFLPPSLLSCPHMHGMVAKAAPVEIVDRQNDAVPCTCMVPEPKLPGRKGTRQRLACDLNDSETSLSSFSMCSRLKTRYLL